MGHAPVCHRQDRRRPGHGQHQLQVGRTGVHPQPVRLKHPLHGQVVQGYRLCGDRQRGGAGTGRSGTRQPADGQAAFPEECRLHRRRHPGRHAQLRGDRRAGRCGERCRTGRRGGHPRPPRGHQHAVHLRHHRLPQGGHAHPLQRRQQRLQHRRMHEADRQGPALHPGPLLPLLRLRPRRPGLRHPRHHHGAGGDLRSRSRCCRPSKKRNAPRSTACRPCSSPNWSTPISTSST